MAPSFTGSTGYPAFTSPAEVLTGNAGTWDDFGIAGASYTYLWQSLPNCTGSSWTDAAGPTKTSLNYTIVAGDVNNCLRLQVTGSNSLNPSWGSNAAASSTSLQVTTQPAFTAQSPPEIADVGYFAGYSFVASGNRITYSVDPSAGTRLPTGMSINSSTGALTGVPAAGTAGVYTYKIIATNASGSVTSDLQTMTVSSGVVDQLVITRQPVGGPSRQALSTQPILRIEDAADRLIANPQTVVVTSTGTIYGTAASPGLASAQGIVNYTGSDLALGGLVDTPYTLTFTTGSGGSARSVTSDPTEVTPGTATALAIVTQPVAAAAAGADLATQPVIRINDADGNRVTSSSAVVTLTPESGGFVGPTASSVATATASSGLATFAGVAFGGPLNVGKTLTFSSPSLTSVTSNPVTSTAVGAPYKLAVTTNATTPSASGASFATSPVVTRQDMAGNTVSTAPQAIVTATVSPSGTYEALVGQTSWTTASGVATFVGLGISGTSGSSYTITFSSTGLVPATQTVVPSVGAAAGLSLTATGAQQPSGARYGADLTQQPIVRIIDSGNNPVSVSGVVVTASVASGDGTITNNTATTNASGIATWTNMRLSGVAGPFTITFSAPGYGTVTSAVFSLQKALQTVTFNALAGKTMGASSFGISATSSADLVITYSTTTPTVCGVSSAGTATGSTPKATSGLVSILGGGTCTITASQAGDSYYDSASASQSFTVSPTTQATLAVVAPATATAGQTVQLYSTGGSGTGAVTFAEASDPAGICSVTSAGVVTFSGTGNSCTFTATKAADASYNVATSAAAMITVAAGGATPSGLSAQSVAFTSTSPATVRVGDNYSATAATTSGLAPTMSIASGSGTVCSISGSASPATVSFLAAGTCQLQASSAADSRFSAASPDAFQTLLVVAASAPAGLLNQSIAFSQPSDLMMGSSDVAMSATASSGLAVTFTSSTTSACTVTSGGIVHPAAVGTCTIVAAQAGDSTYAAADSVTRSFLVTAGVPTAPFVTSVAAGNGSVTVTFVAPGYDGGSAIVGYRMVATPGSGSTVASNACSTSSPCTMNGLTNGTTYTITLAAINAVGIGAYGSGGSIVPTDAPGSPLNPRAVRSGSSVTLTWSQPTLASGVTFVRYDIFQRVAGTSSWGSAIDSVAPISVTSYTVTGLDTDTNYDFRILSVTVPMTDPEDDAASVVESVGLSAPGAPESLATHRVNASAILVTWAAPASNGGSAITGYTVALSPSGSCGTITMDGTTFSASCSAGSLAAGTTFTISVRASNAIGTGAAATTTYATSGGGGGGGGSGGGSGSGGGTETTNSGGSGGGAETGGPGTGGGSGGSGRPSRSDGGIVLPPTFPTPNGPTDEEKDKLSDLPTSKDVTGLPPSTPVKGSGPVPAPGWVPPANAGTASGGTAAGGSGGSGGSGSGLPNGISGQGFRVLDPMSSEVSGLIASGTPFSVVVSQGTGGYARSWRYSVNPNTMLQVVMPLDAVDSRTTFALWVQGRTGIWTSLGTSTVVDGRIVMPVLLFDQPGVYQVVATSMDAGIRARTASTEPVWGRTTIRTIVTVNAADALGTTLCPNMVGFPARSATLERAKRLELRRLLACLGATPRITITGFVQGYVNPHAAQRLADDRAKIVRTYLRYLGFTGRVIVESSIERHPAACEPAKSRCALVEIRVGNGRALLAGDAIAALAPAAPPASSAPPELRADASDPPGDPQTLLASGLMSSEGGAPAGG